MSEKKIVMKINLSKYLGFCEGVERSCQMVVKAIRTSQTPLYMLGSLVHNKEVMKQLKRKGINRILNLDALHKGVLIITAHGISSAIKREAENRGLKIIDTTCPKVVQVQQIANFLKNSNYQIIIIGDKKHVEVKGIKSYAGKQTKIISNIKEAKELKISDCQKVAVVSQTTQDVAKNRKIVKVLKEKYLQLKIYDTICQATKERQKEIKKMAKNNEVILLIGSKTSANTRRLFEISSAINPLTYWIDNKQELKREWFTKIKTVGVLSGASVPSWIITDIIFALKNEIPTL